jgi:hypothetical protein
VEPRGADAGLAGCEKYTSDGAFWQTKNSQNRVAISNFNEIPDFGRACGSASPAA